MTQFDTIAVVDWSGGNDTGPKPRKDAIWLGVVRKGETEKPLYLRNRAVAETALVALIAQEQAAGRRLLIGFDFPFAYPRAKRNPPRQWCHQGQTPAGQASVAHRWQPPEWYHHRAQSMAGR